MKSLLNKLTPTTFLYLGLLVSLGGFLGSLVYSELLELPPCSLCWYQRIALYPCVVIFAVGILIKDVRSAIYALVLSIIGFAIALFQVLLQAGVVKESVLPCKIGVSCAEVGFKLFDLFTIPQQSLVGFLAVIVCCVCALKWDRIRSYFSF